MGRNLLHIHDLFENFVVIRVDRCKTFIPHTLEVG